MQFVIKTPAADHLGLRYETNSRAQRDCKLLMSVAEQ
jgi:hypothetical protein